jgi:N-acetylmuramoyl-L-alanine amidase
MTEPENDKRTGPPGWREGSPSEGQGKAGFFDLPADEVEEYQAPAPPVARRKHIDLKPALKAAFAVALVACAVAAVIMLLPSSTAKVPELVGKNLTDAMETARAGGFNPTVVAWENSPDRDDGVVISQNPESGPSARKGSGISLTVSKGPSSDGAVQPGSETAPGSQQEKVVTIDPGHQAIDARPEWSDPGMTRRVPAEEVFKGVVTGNPEYLVALDIGVKLKDLLEKDGISVVMTRETSTIDLTDVTRAEIAGNAASDLYLRIHCGGSKNPAKSGIRTLYPARSRWTGSFYENSKTAALYVQAALVKSCRAPDRGVADRRDSPAFNWSKVPVIEAEVGFLTNGEDDERLADEEYRSEVALGLKNGISRYLAGQ